MDINTRNFGTSAVMNGQQRQFERQADVVDRKSESAEVAISDRAEQYRSELEKNSQLLFELAPLELPGPADIRQFEQDFNLALQKAGINREEKIELSNDYDGRVIVLNDHPDKERIEALFEDDPELQQQFVKAQTAQMFQKLEQLHQQWLAKVESGMDEEAAGLWLVNEAKALTDRAQTMTFEPEGRENNDSAEGRSPSEVLAALFESVSG